LKAHFRNLYLTTATGITRYGEALIYVIMIGLFMAFVLNQGIVLNTTICLLIGVTVLAYTLTYVHTQHPLAYYSLIITLFPNRASAYHERAEVYRRRKEYRRALTDYACAIQRRPGYARAYIDRARIYYKLREYQSCLKDYEQAHLLDALDTRPYAERGAVYYQLKEYRVVIQDCTAALALDPGYVWAYCYRSQAYNRLGEYELALQDSTHAIKLDSTLAYGCRGQTYLRLSDLQQALTDFSKAWELDPTRLYYGWLIEWSKMCLPQPDTATAERFEALAARDSTHHLASVCRAVAHWLQKNVEAAWRELQQAPPPEPNDEAFSFWRGMICVSLERDDEALAAFEHVLHLPPVLLTPLSWIQHQRPDFYAQEVIPLLAR
jgi:regulator of sirC expression with transglutaminase-like and TPR domain